MGIITSECPHCRTAHVALRVVAATAIEDRRYAAHLQCPKCKLPCACVIVAGNHISIDIDGVRSSGEEIRRHGWNIGEFWPKPAGPAIPEHLPEAASRAMLQAERNFPVEGNEEAAGTMYRKAIELALKHLDPALSGTLQKRIDALVERHMLTPDLGQWAHQIRVLGNESVHDEEPPTRDELTALRSFTSLALQYLFTLPKMVELRKAPAAP